MKDKPIKEIGRYQIIEKIGEGGMGTVYKALDPMMDRLVAIKVLQASIISETNKQRFLREAKVMAGLSHPNIVTFYHVEKENTFDYIVMDFVDGKLLSSCSLNTRQALKIMKDVALAMDYAHKQGVVHRDLKPGNILIKNNDPIVMDFGLAKSFSKENLTKTGDILGTPQYMAPEQVLGKVKAISAKTDIYALGIILYELLTGKSAVKGKSTGIILYNVVNESITPIQKHKPNLAKELQTICAKATMKDPKIRYKSARELAEDINSFLKGEVVKSQKFFWWHYLKFKLKKYAIKAMVVLCFFMLCIALWKNSLEKNSRQQQQQILQQVQKIFQSIPAEFVNINSLKQVPRVSEKVIVEIVETYFKILKLLGKLSQTKATLLSFRIYKNIGFIALAQNDYLLSFRVFQQCQRFSPQKAQNLLNIWKTKKKKNSEKQLKYIEQVMHSLLTKTPKNKELDVWVNQVVQMKNSLVVKKILSYMQSPNNWQRLLAIKSLGKLGNTFTKFQKKDAVEWLLMRLKKGNQFWEIKEIIWALGWLRDNRAHKQVFKTRMHYGEAKLLWSKTKIPARWLSGSKQEAISAKEYFLRALDKSLKGKQQEAIFDFNKAIELNPKYKTAYLQRGVTWALLKKSNKALADISKAIELDPNYAEAYNNRAGVWLGRREFDKAIVDYSKALKLLPNAQLYYNRAGLWAKKRQWDKAITDYTQAIRINPDFIYSYNSRGRIWFLKGKLGKALSDYNQAIRRNPKDHKGYANRANVWGQKGQVQKALFDFNQAISINPRDAEVYLLRANLWSKLGKLDKALLDYNQSIAFDPQQYITYSKRGLVLEKKKMFKKALVDFSKAIQLNPRSVYAYLRKAAIYNHIGNLAAAIAHLHKVEMLLPKHATTKYNLACFYAKQKNKQKALLYLQKALRYGFNKKNVIKKDPDLNFIRKYPEFNTILKKYGF